MDTWLSMWENMMVNSGGQMIPMITSIGNHEVGGYNKNPKYDPFYLNYFVHENLNGGEPKSLFTYHKHRIGTDVAFVVLDSNIITKASDQVEWLNSTLYSLIDRHNIFTLYHVGLYPSVRYQNDPIHVDLRNSWGSLFDQYVKISFENHDHTFKKTYPISNFQKSTTGTIYLGDGALGLKSNLYSLVPVDRRDVLKVIERVEEKIFFPLC